MARYIDADEFEKAYNAMLEFSKKFCGLIKPNILDLLNQAPTADVQEVKHGKWLKPSNSPIDNRQWICSECKGLIETAYHCEHCYYNYCANCGARMDSDSSDG